MNLAEVVLAEPERLIGGQRRRQRAEPGLQLVAQLVPETGIEAGPLGTGGAERLEHLLLHW